MAKLLQFNLFHIPSKPYKFDDKWDTNVEQLHLADYIHIPSKPYKFDDKWELYVAKLHLADYLHISSKSYKFDYKRDKYVEQLLLTDYTILSELQGLFYLDSVWGRINLTHYYYSWCGVEMDIQHISINGAKS